MVYLTVEFNLLEGDVNKLFSLWPLAGWTLNIDKV